MRVVAVDECTIHIQQNRPYITHCAVPSSSTFNVYAPDPVRYYARSVRVGVSVSPRNQP
jgi:hypothetical protein